MWARLATALGVALSIACGSSAPPEGPSTTESSSASSESTEGARPRLEGRTLDGCFVTDDAPAPLACASDDDCTAGGLLVAGTCCMSGVTHAHSRAYHEWQSRIFRERCGGTCMQPPSPPEDCEITLRCDEGRCRNACGEIPATSDEDLDAMDRGELEAACEAGSTAACDRLGH